MITLQEAIDKSKQSMTAVATTLGVSASQISLVASHNYKNWELKEKEIIEKMVSVGLISSEQSELEVVAESDGQLRVHSTKFITTKNTIALDNLAKDLLDPTTTLNASIGVVYGRAGYGKTTAIKHFCATNERAIYVLFCEGYSTNMLMKAISREFGAVPCFSFDKNLEQIRQATAVYRRLICIDEADHMPLKVLETIRGLNELCGVPIMLVGEYGLQAKMGSLPRMESRIRSKPVEFEPLSTFDISSFYLDACGIDLTGKDKLLQQLLKRCHGDFRIMVNDAHQIVTAMNTYGMTELNQEVLDGVKQ